MQSFTLIYEEQNIHVQCTCTVQCTCIQCTMYMLSNFCFYHFNLRFHAEIRELQRLIETYDIRYFPSHVLLCTSTVHDQSADICIQGYLGILWIRNTKSSKIDWIHKCYVCCFKLEYLFKSCKTEPLNWYYMQQVAVRWHSKNLS